MRNKEFTLLIFLLPFLALLSSGQTPLQQAWVAPSFTDTLKNPVVWDVQAQKEAKKIYESLCWTCHGLAGKGDGPAGLKLNPRPADHTTARVQGQTDGAIYWKITTGKGNMVPYGKTYSAKQRWELVNYIRHLGKENQEAIK